MYLPTTRVRDLLATKRLYPDKLVRTVDGGFKYRRCFFYRHDMSAEKLAGEIGSIKGFKVYGYKEVSSEWPKDSYFEVYFKAEEA